MTAPSSPDTIAPDPGPGDGEGGEVELFPVNFTTYRHDLLPDLDTDHHVRAIADLLAPYGARTTEWTVPPARRDSQAVSNRLKTWKQAGGNTVLYWVGHGSAKRLAHHETDAPVDDGTSSLDIADAIARRQFADSADGADSWAIVVLDACFSEDFARAVHLDLFTHHRGAGRYLLLSTAARGYTELGELTRALQQALHITFPTQRAIGLSALGRELAGRLGGFFDDLTVDDRRDQLFSLTPTAATTASGSLEQLAELQAVIDQLPADEQRHFLPKATGAELGELAWYFHGRTRQRDQILHWLTTTTSGALVVTGPAGSGKSALLGHILLHTNTRLRDLLVRNGHLTPLPPGVACPDDPFDLTVHLAGLSPARVLHLIAEAVGHADLAEQAAGGQLPADLTARLLARLRERHEPLTLLFDALDEADQPLVIADQILRPLAAVPTVRLIVGTRRSTREGPDQPAPADTDLLDALHPQTAAPGSHTAPGPQYVKVSRDAEAIADYLRAKLHAAKHRGALHADYTLIEETVRRLVTDDQESGAEPQQFLYARLAAHELLNDPDLIIDPGPLVGRTHRELFDRALQRLQGVNPHYLLLLQALGLAQGRGLPDQDGIWATAADALTTSPTGTRHSIGQLLRDAAPYLALDQEHGQSVYRLAHRTFTEHFTTAPDAARAHARITTALTAHARETLQHRHTPGAASRPADVSPYIRHHLAAHARLGHTAGALTTLDAHPDVLDTLDLTSLTTNALQHGLDPGALPPAIAGTVLHQHHAHDTANSREPGTATVWRRWWRRLGTTYIQGTPPPAEPHPRNTGTWPPTLTAGTVRPRQLHLQLTGHDGEVLAVAVFTAPDRTPRLVTGGNDGTVRIWNPATGAQEGEPLTGHDGGVNAVAVFTAPDGTPRLATGGGDFDGTVRIWNPATHAHEGEPLTSHDGVLAVAVFTAPDGTPRLATVGYDGTVRIWNPATHAQEGGPLTGHGWVLAVAVFTAPDGTPRLATGGYDGTVRIWDPRTRTAHVLPMADEINALASGHNLLIAGTKTGFLAIDVSSVPTDVA
ncbi:AAA family ATPase [Kitasatospora purpeofusca]|uniref:AAA family ATPase n=1 Tax=Kitasatospora purpeofusca TaxID=67352 RepID=UPI0035D559B7